MFLFFLCFANSMRQHQFKLLFFFVPRCFCLFECILILLQDISLSCLCPFLPFTSLFPLLSSPRFFSAVLLGSLGMALSSHRFLFDVSINMRLSACSARDPSNNGLLQDPALHSTPYKIMANCKRDGLVARVSK